MKKIIITISCKRVFTLKELDTKHIEDEKRFFEDEKRFFEGYRQYKESFETHLKSVLKVRYSSLKRRLTQMGYAHVELPYNNDINNYNFVMSALHELYLETLNKKKKK